jgi:hypothetical protein
MMAAELYVQGGFDRTDGDIIETISEMRESERERETAEFMCSCSSRFTTVLSEFIHIISFRSGKGDY